MPEDSASCCMDGVAARAAAQASLTSKRDIFGQSGAHASPQGGHTLKGGALQRSQTSFAC